ncbi:MAG: YceD family protein [Halioglobus sp.]|nr:YceD family protein [Halioglobus sp.]
MLTDPLPTALDVRKAAVRGAGVSGILQPGEMPRFRAMLASDEGHIEADLSFFRDEESRYLIRVDVSADVEVICQRCLQPMREHVGSDNTLAVVWTDEQAAALPRRLDPLIVPEQICNLHELVEEELMLSLRMFSYHDHEDCKNAAAVFPDPAAGENSKEARSNPFEVLAQLKPGDTDQE